MKPTYNANELLQSVREKPYPDEDRVKGDPARDLATVHHVCETHLAELVDISRELNSVKVRKV